MSCKTIQHAFQAYSSINSTSINPKQQQQSNSKDRDYYVARGQKELAKVKFCHEVGLKHF